MTFSQWLPVSRRGGGEYNTQNFTIPVGVDNVRVRLDVVPDDFTTSDLSVTATVQISIDGAQTWQDEMVVGWLGSIQTPPPGKEIGWFAAFSDVSRYAGMLVRVHFSTSGTFRWGLEGELIP